MKTTLETSDTDLKINILAELEFDPSVKVTDIGVLVKDGTVTLLGVATSYGEKFAAVRSAKRVAGVKGIADDIKVHLPDYSRRNDGDIAAAAVHQLDWNTTIPSGAAKVTVREGWITLEGEMPWWYQKEAAEAAIQHVAGLRGLTNLIKIVPHPSPAVVEADIESAFDRNALLCSSKILVETSGSEVILRGQVRSYAEREEAERVAWAASGVLSVDNELEVEWFWGTDI
jgi:osmotically-inducible protein OsmY